jgi:hypothetical protein
MIRQVCPLCKINVTPNLKFPYYLCKGCENKVTDRNNNPVTYKPQNTPTGFKAHYRENLDRIYLYDICYVEGKEFKAYSDQGKTIFIQPLNFLEYASRPDEKNLLPSDAESNKITLKGKILLRKILVPAIIVAFLNTILPLISLFTLVKNKSLFNSHKILILISITCITTFFTFIIIKKVERKFARAHYFKQHSWAFFILGILSFTFSVLFLIFNSK